MFHDLTVHWEFAIDESLNHRPHTENHGKNKEVIAGATSISPPKLPGEWLVINHTRYKQISIFFIKSICDFTYYVLQHIDGFTQGCSNSSANALELLQSCAKPSTYHCRSPVTQKDYPLFQKHTKYITSFKILPTIMRGVKHYCQILYLNALLLMKEW